MENSIAVAIRDASVQLAPVELHLPKLDAEKCRLFLSFKPGQFVNIVGYQYCEISAIALDEASNDTVAYYDLVLEKDSTETHICVFKYAYINGQMTRIWSSEFYWVNTRKYQQARRRFMQEFEAYNCQA